MRSTGDEAPDFELLGSTGDSIGTYTLSGLLADGPVLLAFYPLDFSPVCTEEVCGLRDTQWFEFTADLTVVGISTDGPYAHQAFARQYDLEFPLLADTDGRVADAYGVRYGANETFPGVAKRATFLVDRDRIIRSSTVQEDPESAPDLESVRQALMQAGV